MKPASCRSARLPQPVGARLDLIVIDAETPRIDVVEAVAAVRAREAGTGSRLPIVAMAADTTEGGRERFLAAGMDGCVARPIGVSEFVDVIDRVATALPRAHKDVA
jgi:CheY-like chemotaxis protein